MNYQQFGTIVFQVFQLAHFDFLNSICIYHPKTVPIQSYRHHAGGNGDDSESYSNSLSLNKLRGPIILFRSIGISAISGVAQSLSGYTSRIMKFVIRRQAPFFPKPKLNSIYFQFSSRPQTQTQTKGIYKGQRQPVSFLSSLPFDTLVQRTIEFFFYTSKQIQAHSNLVQFPCSFNSILSRLLYLTSYLPSLTTHSPSNNDVNYYVFANSCAFRFTRSRIRCPGATCKQLAAIRSFQLGAYVHKVANPF